MRCRKILNWTFILFLKKKCNNIKFKAIGHYTVINIKVYIILTIVLIKDLPRDLKQFIIDKFVYLKNNHCSHEKM